MSDDQKTWAKTLAAKQRMLNDAEAEAQKTNVEQDAARIKMKIETAVENSESLIRVEKSYIPDDVLNLLSRDGVYLTPFPSWTGRGSSYQFKFIV
jgi:hypothetical protein